MSRFIFHFYYDCKCPISGVFFIHRVKNVFTERVLKKWSALLHTRSCRIARNLGYQGTWLPIISAFTYVYMLSRPAVAQHLAQSIAESGLNQLH